MRLWGSFGPAKILVTDLPIAVPRPCRAEVTSPRGELFRYVRGSPLVESKLQLVLNADRAA